MQSLENIMDSIGYSVLPYLSFKNGERRITPPTLFRPCSRICPVYIPKTIIIDGRMTRICRCRYWRTWSVPLKFHWVVLFSYPHGRTWSIENLELWLPTVKSAVLRRRLWERERCNEKLKNWGCSKWCRLPTTRRLGKWNWTNIILISCWTWDVRLKHANSGGELIKAQSNEAPWFGYKKSHYAGSEPS